MASYAGLLRTSRLVALPPATRTPTPQNLFPTRPAIRTTRANQAVGDWGLKRALPRLRTQNVTISDMDTQEHQTPFDSGNQYTKFVQRWQEMGLAVVAPPETGDFTQRQNYMGARPENVNKGINLQYLSRAKAKRLVAKAGKLRSSFMAAKGIASDTVYSVPTLGAARKKGNDYLGIVNSKVWSVQPNGGLAYHHRGALPLVNTPEGPRERQLTARVLNGRTTSRVVGLGGIVTSLRMGSLNEIERAYRDRGRAATVPIYEGDAQFEADGQLSLNLGSTRPSDFAESKRARISAVWNRSMAETKVPGDAGYTDDDMESSSLWMSLDSLGRSSPLSGKEEKK